MGGGARSPFLNRVRDVLSRQAVTCTPETTALAIARLLSAQGVGAVIVVRSGTGPLGIVTDRDLRRKVVAEGRDATGTCAADIMSSPVVSVPSSALAFEAILEMTRRDIRHLAVIDDGRLTGVVSMYDFLLSQSLHPVLLAREITRAASLDALALLSGRIIDLARLLVEEGGTPHDVGQIISELHDRVVVRVLGLTVDALEQGGHGTPPGTYCWLGFGSEARREQTLRTDQDNGLVFDDPPEDARERVAGYYTRLGEAAVRALVHVGVPPCPGEIMASNPRWCQPLSVWRDYFRGWITDHTPSRVLDASIHFDLRPIGGARELAESLQEVVRQEAPRHPVFLTVLARDVVERRVPLTLLGRVATRRADPHRGAVDLKGAGTLQLVGAARVHALELGLSATNTLERFQGAGARHLYSSSEVQEIGDAAQHLMRLRLVHQLAQHARGTTPDNFVVPALLSHADRVLLREALRTVTWVQGRLRERFATDFAPP